MNKSVIEIISPEELPKNLLNSAPVYPINADISNPKTNNILARSIGLNKLIAKTIFSIG